MFDGYYCGDSCLSLFRCLFTSRNNVAQTTVYVIVLCQHNYMVCLFQLSNLSACFRRSSHVEILCTFSEHSFRADGLFNLLFTFDVATSTLCF